MRQVPLDEYDEFIIMASDGLWDKVSAQEAVDMVSKYLEQKVRSMRPVAHAPPPPGTPLAMDAVQTPYNNDLDLPKDEENARLKKQNPTKFKMTAKLNQLSLEERRSKKKQISAQLINEAMERGSQDNCTVIVVFFQWEETNS